MENYLDQKKTEVIELTINEMMVTEGGTRAEKWMVAGAFLLGFAPGLFAMGYYNATH
ncbi:hypothetical protein [uncultured Flavobacterium sp.]|uniref:hypothetical protein n=1 Tax=uncultured Flavobacterium sp. TaxID=165435 RepID=UPI0030814D6B